MEKRSIVMQIGRRNIAIATTLTDRMKIKSTLADIGRSMILAGVKKEINLIVSYSVFNEISSTWMDLITYYPKEDRFVN